MNRKYIILLALLILPPYLGELLSASSPPLVFFNPAGFFYLVMFYGCGTILIRELRVRWKLQWPVILLAAAYGIVEEGIMVKSFFNPGWGDMGSFSSYGMYLGVQWVWVIMLLIYHATLSTLIPIALMDLLWPDCATEALMKDKNLIMTTVLFFAVTVLGTFYWGNMVEGKMLPFFPKPILMIASIALVFTFVYFAYWFRTSYLSVTFGRVWPPFLFGVAGFLQQGLNFWGPVILAGLKVPASATICGQMILSAMILLFIGFQIYHQQCTRRHLIALCSGALLQWIIITPIHEFAKTDNPEPMRGMLWVGVISLVLLLSWRKKALSAA